MDLADRKDTLLEILRQFNIHLDDENFKRPKKLAWAQRKLHLIGQPMREALEFVKGGRALEEPTTGYFFAARYDERSEKWILARAPVKDDPTPLAQKVPDEQLVSLFRSWGQDLKQELDAPRPWGEKLAPGSMPLGLGQIARLTLTLASRGFLPDQLKVHAFWDEITLRPESHGWASFTIRRGFQVQLSPGSRPGDWTREEERGPLDWEQLLEALDDWLGYVKREASR